MKKVFGIIVIGLFVASCGGSTETKPVETDSVKVDSVQSIDGGSGPRPSENIK